MRAALPSDLPCIEPRHPRAASERASSDIRYYVRRLRSELGQMRAATKREVAMVHFMLASGYLQRIHDLADGTAGQSINEELAHGPRRAGPQITKQR